MNRKHTCMGCLSLLVHYTSPAAPETDVTPWQVNEFWPTPDLRDYHPPFDYHIDEDDLYKATFMILNHNQPNPDDDTAGTGFFIKTNRNDNLLCAITAGHIYDVNNHEVENIYPNYEMFNHYKYTGGKDGVSFYPAANNMYIVSSIYDSYRDIALMLVDPSTINAEVQINQLDYVLLPIIGEALLWAYAPTTSVHHSYAWPMNLSEGVVTSGEFMISFGVFDALDLYDSVAKGASGAAFTVNDVALGAITDRTLQHTISVNVLSRLAEDIDFYCNERSSKTHVVNTVYKVSTLAPSIVFKHGFAAGTADSDIYAQASGNSCASGNSGLVSVTSLRSFAKQVVQDDLYLSGENAVYIYKIRADDHIYDVNRSLMAQYQATGETNYQTLAKLTEHQDEYVAKGGIAPAQILAANRYVKGYHRYSIEQDATYLNPHYVAGSTHSNALPLKDFPQPAKSVQLSLAQTFDSQLHNACFTFCDAAQRSDEESCYAEDVFAVDPTTASNKATVYNPALAADVEVFVPWHDRHWQSHNGRASMDFPHMCKLVPGVGNDRDQLCVYCGHRQRGPLMDDNFYFDEADLLLYAAGSANTWVESTIHVQGLYEGGVESCYSSSDIPVVGTDYTLADYGYSIYDVFSGNGSGWWSSLKLQHPTYPMFHHP